MSRRQWSEAEVQRETLAALRAVSKASGCTIKLAGLEVTTPPERAAALAKAFDYRQTAGRMVNQAEAAAYRDLAARTLKEAGLAS